MSLKSGAWRIKDTQTATDRAAKGKHALKSRHAVLATRGNDPLPGYVARMFPGTDLATKKAIANAIRRYMTMHDQDIAPTKRQVMASGMLDGLV